MAIIMTIVVLEFAVPGGTNWSDMKELGSQVIVYALSFFWLGMMWININTICNQISAEILKTLNPVLEPMVKTLRKGIAIDLCVKTVGIILGMIFWPPIVTIAVFVAMICLVIEFSAAHKKGGN
ncbi:MAG: DUF1211 domain-containing protein [Lachnospiraceae bacterium]|nr:DUF1211 domain-containing protein [Lachnospiraceae bacterium]